MSLFDINTSLEDFGALLNKDELVEVPVDLDTFIFDPYYLGPLKIKKISEIQRTIIERTSQIYKLPTLIKLHGNARANEIWNEETVHEIIAVLGKGSGKDFSTRIAFAYIAYKLHCLADPIEYYDKSHGTYIDLLNVAVNAKQANNVFFTPLKNMLTMSPYFQDQGFEPRKDSLEFDQRPIRLHSGNSEAEAWEGLDLIVVVLDEIAAFKTEAQFQKANAGGAQRLGADAIYQMSKASVMSRFPDIGKCALLSFPRFKSDFIMNRYEQAAEESHVYRIKAATWEVNPIITREMLEPEFKRNPVSAEQRFGANPPEMIDAFFRDPQRVRQCFKGTHQLVGEGDEAKLILKENKELHPITEVGTFKPWFKATDEYMRFIHVDLGLKRDRAALAMCHSPGTRKVEIQHGIYEQMPVVKMDLIHYWEAQEGQEIDFANIREFIKLLTRNFPVGLVTLDRWQSVDTIQILSKQGIPCDTHSVKRNDYDTLATAFYDGRFSGYFHQILIEDELLKLQTLPNGKVDHPDGFHDDLAQALASATWHACQYADLDTEIDISVLGLDEDWEELESLWEEFDERAKSDHRFGKEKTEMTFDDPEDDWTIEAI